MRSGSRRPVLRNALASVGLGRLVCFSRKLRHPIRRGDLVLDIGSGGDPHPRADVLLERYVDSGYHRTVRFRRSAPVVIADIAAMPFRDGAFDYSICAHVLEHVEDPAGAAREITRVSKAGYVETPSAIHERFWPQAQHVWMVSEDDGGLVFDAKTSAHGDLGLVTFFEGRWSRDRPLMNWLWRYEQEFFIEHMWQGSLVVEVNGVPRRWLTEAEIDELGLLLGDRNADSPRKRQLYEWLSRVRYG